MPKSYEQVRASLDAGNIMDWTNALNRLNGIPIDPTSIFNTYNDAVIYAATSAVAYVNQLVVAAGVAYIVASTSQGTLNISGTQYPIYLIPLPLQRSVDDITARIITLESALNFDTIVIDGGNAAQAEAEASS